MGDESKTQSAITRIVEFASIIVTQGALGGNAPLTNKQNLRYDALIVRRPFVATYMIMLLQSAIVARAVH